MDIKFSLVAYDHTKGNAPSGTVFYESKQGYDLAITGLNAAPIPSTRVPGRNIDARDVAAVSKEYDIIANACLLHIADARNHGFKVEKLEGSLVGPMVLINSALETKA